MHFICTALLRLSLSSVLVGLLLPTAGLANTVSFSVNGNLLGAQSMPQFDPGTGTLTGVALSLTSTLSGTVSGGGMMGPSTPGPLVPGPETCQSVPGPPGFPPMEFCSPGPMVPGPSLPGMCIVGAPSLVNVAASGMGGSLVVVPSQSFAVSGSEECDPASFSSDQNFSSAVGPLNSYVGTGTLPFIFSATTSAGSLTGPSWTGTLQVDYTYSPLVTLPAEAPEPASALLAVTALAALAACKRLHRAAKIRPSFEG